MEFQHKYAKIIIDLDDINKVLQIIFMSIFILLLYYYYYYYYYHHHHHCLQMLTLSFCSN